MTTLLKLTDKEAELIVTMKDAILALSNQAGTDSNIEAFFSEKDVDANGLHSVLWDIINDELFKAIARYNQGKTKDVAQDTDGVGFTVVEILHGFYDNVFGYTEENGIKTYYLCETKEFWNDELEEDETHFFVDDYPVILENCLRIDFMGGM